MGRLIAAVDTAFILLRWVVLGVISDEVAEPEKIVKISESENRGLWSSCVVASVFKRIKPLQSALR
jgi:hypothetical protein